MPGPIKVLVVDDSSLVRRLLADIVNSDPDMEIVGTAANGAEAVKAVSELDPDVITMDIHMPEMDGLTALEYIMQKDPRPVVMLSALTRQGAIPTLRSLELGAVDFIAKPAYMPAEARAMREEVLAKIRMAAGTAASMRREAKGAVRQAKRFLGRKPATARAVVIGASAGGPKALAEMLPELPIDIPAAILIVQHMPPVFTRTFAERLDHRSEIRVKEAESGDRLAPGLALVAPGGFDLSLTHGGARVLLSESRPHRATPAIDVSMNSVAEHFGEGAIGVLLTGMGTDGAEGMARIKEKQGKTVAQNEETSLVFGMPRAAIERRVVDCVVPLQEIPDTILGLL